MSKQTTHHLWISLTSAFLIIAALGLVGYKLTTSRVYIEKAEISAPHVNLATQTGGILQETFVHEGDVLPAYSVVARVGNALIQTKTNAQIISISKNIGKTIAPNESVATIINPSELRVVAHIEEDKGLRELRIGNNVTFNVDAFGTQTFYGTVDQIAPSSREGSLVFSISDKRESKVFDISIRFDVNAYPNLKDGMSAKVWVNK